MNSKEALCINCEKETIAAYCHSCGQKQGINRLTWVNLFQDLQQRVFGFDNNFLRTVRDLSIRPKVVIQSSIDGIRMRYMGPVGYFFLMLTIFLVISSLFDVNTFESSANLGSKGLKDANPELITRLLATLNEYSRLTSFLMMPFYISGFWILFKNKGYNFLETSVLAFYSYAHNFFITIPLIPLLKLYPDAKLIQYLFLFLIFLYAPLVVTFFYKGNKIWNFFKAIFGMGIGVILFFLSLSILLIIMVIAYPELFKDFSHTIQ